MQPLRHLAVTVIQSANKAYRWRVAELTPDGKWFTVDDLAVGPREEDLEAPPPKRKGGLFGFGFGVQRA